MTSSWNNSVIIKKTLPKLGKLAIMKDIKSGEMYLGKKTRYESFNYFIHEGNHGTTGFTNNRIWKYIPTVDENHGKWKSVKIGLDTNKIVVFHLNDDSSFPYILGYIDEKNNIRHGINYCRKTPINEADYFFEID